MPGNVHEWCSDIAAMYESDSQTDPQGPESAEDTPQRVFRGHTGPPPRRVCTFRVTGLSEVVEVTMGLVSALSVQPVNRIEAINPCLRPCQRGRFRELIACCWLARALV